MKNYKIINEDEISNKSEINNIHDFIKSAPRF